MIRPQFDIRFLLILTAAAGCGLSFAIQTEHWLIALLVTILLTNVAAAFIALMVYVVLPMAEKRPVSHEPADAD